MKTATLLRVGHENFAARWFGLLAVAALFSAAVSLPAQTTVTTIGGGPQYYNPGSNFGSSNSIYGTLESQFHTPSGIAYDDSQDYLYVADRDNNAVRLIDLAASPSHTYTFAPYPPYVPTNVISQPVGVAVDALGDVFVLNRGKGTNGFVVEFNYLGYVIATNMMRLTNASGIALDANNNIYVTASNTVFRITPAGVSNVVVTITNAGASLQGIVMKKSGSTAGLLAVADSGRNGIYLIDPATGAVTTNAGFNGVGDGTGNHNQGVYNTSAQFFQPSGLVEEGDGSLIVADFGNNRVKVVTASGITTNLYGVSSNLWWTGKTPTGGTAYTGWSDGAVIEPDVASDVQARMPSGLALGSDGTIYSTEDYYHIIRQVTGANIQPPPLPPPPPPPPPAPVIGTVSFPAPNYLSLLTPVTSFVFNNDVIIAIAGTNGTTTLYTSGATGTVPDPTTNSSTASFYQDGLPSVLDLGTTRYPDMTIKAITVNGDGESSPEISARFQFIVANPTISGNNAAQFTVTDVTTNALMYYTVDGSNPTNDGSGTSIGPISSGAALSLQVPAGTNLTFKIRGFRANYQPSQIAATVFTAAGFAPNTISFGFASGEASSDFVASPGQTFYAPVTLTTLPGTVMYSLQFNVTANTAGPNPGPALVGLPASLGFQSMLMKIIPGTTPPLFTNIPTFMFVGGTGFTNLAFFTNNLMGVGWVERAGATNLYDTTKQTLITYSMAHDDLFPNLNQPNQVIVGGYSFQVPAAAINGQTYQIQIGRPSATSDGIGTPGSSVFIDTPTNGSLTSGAINAIKTVTVGNRRYLAGNVYPFRWFNAGDFGNTNLQNADVEQVFQSAVYALNYPPFHPNSWNGFGYTNVSDFYDAMDSCGNFGALDADTANPNYGYYTNANNAPFSSAQQNALFNGNDTTINQIGFGDGKLDICDVYVTYRRSLDTNDLVWFQRFWTNGVRVAVVNPAPVFQSAVKKPSGKNLPAFNSGSAFINNAPSVNFAAGDFQATAGQTIQIPVTASVFGPYPLRVAMLNISVVPLDGSPALTTPIAFSASPALGQPSSGFTVSSGNGNYAAAWLDSTIAGISSNATIGTLTITLPANATSLSAYAVHFDHASASPNGLASFPKQAATGLITLSSRSTSSYNDGIPDAWRLRWFGTVNNLLSISNASPSGDGVNNWAKYVAGVDPTTPNDFPSVNLKTPVPAGATAAIHWPTVSGKQYVILRSTSLFPGNWTTIATNTGTGSDLEFDDAATGQTWFYRVQILP